MSDPPLGRVFRPGPATSQTTRIGQTTVFPVEIEGRTFSPSKGGWKTNRDGMRMLSHARRLMPVGQTLTYVRYFDDFPAFPFNPRQDARCASHLLRDPAEQDALVGRIRHQTQDDGRLPRPHRHP